MQAPRQRTLLQALLFFCGLLKHPILSLPHSRTNDRYRSSPAVGDGIDEGPGSTHPEPTCGLDRVLNVRFGPLARPPDHPGDTLEGAGPREIDDFVAMLRDGA